MYVVTVTFTLHDGMADAFMPLMRAQAENSLKFEDGCHQFDVSHHTDDPYTIFLYELYTDKDAFENHLKSFHFKDFDGKVNSMIKEKTVRCFDQHFAAVP